MTTGRKSLRDELKIINRFAELAPKYFKVINEHLDSKSKLDRQWAVERLDKAFAKMIPQTLDGMGENGEIQVQIVKYSLNADSATLPVQSSELPNSDSQGV